MKILATVKKLVLGLWVIILTPIILLMILGAFVFVAIMKLFLRK